MTPRERIIVALLLAAVLAGAIVRAVKKGWSPAGDSQRAESDPVPSTSLNENKGT